jgi:hypothetical protein
MNDKIVITGSEFADTDLSHSVCSHLQPLLDYFESKGARWDKGAALYTDRGGAHTLKIKFKIDFDDVRRNFEIPRFIDIAEEHNSIVCRKCWCDIEGI